MLEKNLQILTDRWPELSLWLESAKESTQVELVREQSNQTLVIDGIQLTSRFDRQKEAALQASLIPAGSQVARVYGLALGDLPRELLRRQELQKLDVVVLNAAVAKSCLTHFDQSDWLADPRVRVLTAVGKRDVEFPFAAAPACLQLADESAMHLRDRVVLELATPHIRSKFSEKNARLSDRIAENASYLEQDGDVSVLFGQQQGRTVAVAGAGPTLAEHYRFLRENSANIYLLAVDAALKSLLEAGVVPDAVIAIDDGENEILQFFSAVELAPLKNTPLIYFPIVHHKVLDIWPGGRLAAYPQHALYQTVAKKYPKGRLFSSGSVIHPAIDLLVKMGAAEVILLGTDFAFPGGVSHVAGSAVRIDQPQTAYEHWVVDGHGQRVNTSIAMRGFLRDLENYIQHQPAVTFINGSRTGAKIEGTRLLENCTW